METLILLEIVIVAIITVSIWYMVLSQYLNTDSFSELAERLF